MRFFLGLSLYRLLLPLLFLAAFPGWLVKMLRRGGLNTPLGERIGRYRAPLEFEPCGAVHVHAVSVGEALLALKLIREWLRLSPNCRFVLATGTATGFAVAASAAVPGLRVTYAPLDLRGMVRRSTKRQPAASGLAWCADNSAMNQPSVANRGCSKPLASNFPMWSVSPAFFQYGGSAKIRS